ncbi:hypothetical protein LTR16_007817, partial [Cryomyces antarcticus]
LRERELQRARAVLHPLHRVWRESEEPVRGGCPEEEGGGEVGDGEGERPVEAQLPEEGVDVRGGGGGCVGRLRVRGDEVDFGGCEGHAGQGDGRAEAGAFGAGEEGRGHETQDGEVREVREEQRG